MSREVGTVKWYGGHNSRTDEINQYGFIAHGLIDLYVHRSNLLCSETDLAENVTVVFIVGMRKGRTEAREVRLLSQEIEFLITQVENSESVTELASILSQCSASQIKQIIDYIPLSIQGRPEIIPYSFPYLTSIKKITAILERLKITSQEFEIGNLITRIVDLLSQDKTLARELPDDIKAHNAIFELLDPIDQVNFVWSTKENLPQIWERLSRQARLFCIFRAAKENIDLFELYSEIGTESDPIIKVALYIFYAKYHPTTRQEAFQKAHNVFQNYIVEEAWGSTEPFDLFPLLPNCLPGLVGHCEARPWLTEEDKQNNSHRASRVFCPRARGQCDFFYRYGINQNYSDYSAR